MTSTEIISCENCGGHLDAQGDARIVTCKYCGANTKVKRTVVDAVPAPQIPIPGGVRPRRRRKIAWIIPLIIVGVLATVGGYMAWMHYLLNHNMPDEPAVPESVEPSVEQEAYRPVLPDSPRPFVLDVNGDGTEDLVGSQSMDWNGSINLVAWSGTDFSELWRSQSLGIPARDGQPILYNVGTLILVSTGASLTAFDGSTGGRYWTAVFPDKPEHLSMKGTELRVEAVDGSRHLVNLQVGTVRADPEKKPVEFRLRTDGEHRKERGAYMEIPSSSHWKDYYLQTAYCPEDRMSKVKSNGKKLVWHSSKTFCRYGDVGLAYVERAKGTRLPFLLAYDRAKTKNIRWTLPLSPPGTLQEATYDPAVARNGDLALAVYPLDRKELFAHLIRMSDGSTIWKSSLGEPDGAGESASGVILTNNRAYVHTGSRLLVLGVADGRIIVTMDR